jgi:NADH-quinone oxidoreductase subunit J
MVGTILFWIFAIIGIAGAVGLIFNRNAVYAALSLVLNFFSIAGLYLTLNAEFLAVIQVIVYAGAIMVLFLFVIMLLNLRDEQGVTRSDLRRGVAFLLGAAFIAELVLVFRSFQNKPLNTGTFPYGKVEPVGEQLMTQYLFPFEMISVILIAALIGAIIVARKYRHSDQ